MSRRMSRRQATGILGAAATSLLVGEARAEHANVAERVARLIVKHMEIARAKVTPEARFKADLGADSLDCIELVMAAEEEFDIVVDDKVAYQMQTVAQMIGYIAASPKAPPRPSRNEEKKK